MERLIINKKFNIEVKRLSRLGCVIGLMFKSKNTDNLLFEFKKERNWDIHSLFVFFPFLALWIDKNNKIIEKKIVKPFTLSIRAKRKYKKLIEIPFNEKNYNLIKKIMIH